MALEPLRSRIGFLRRLLGQDCILCAAPSGDTPFCAGCAHDLPELGDARPRCAGPSPGGAVCGTCLSDPPSFDATFAAWRYGFPVDRLVLALKYGGRLALARAFGAALAARVRDTPPQTDLPHDARAANVRGAFACMRAVAGRSAAIVDDVMTTGASLEELAGTLKRAGAARVENWGVARVWRR